MKPIHRLIVVSLLIGEMICCKAQKNHAVNQGVLTGKTGIYTGNCMPSPNRPPCKPEPISTTIYIARLSEVYSEENLIDSVRSDGNGEYTIKLDRGEYSLFLRDGQKISCTGVQCNPQCACMPFIIKEDSTTTINVNLDHANW